MKAMAEDKTYTLEELKEEMSKYFDELVSKANKEADKYIIYSKGKVIKPTI